MCTYKIIASPKTVLIDLKQGDTVIFPKSDGSLRTVIVEAAVATGNPETVLIFWQESGQQLRKQVPLKDIFVKLVSQLPELKEGDAVTFPKSDGRLRSVILDGAVPAGNGEDVLLFWQEDGRPFRKVVPLRMISFSLQPQQADQCTPAKENKASQ
jgi:hypothetical protein